MFPSNHRLLHSARNALRRIVAGGVEPSVAAALTGTGVLVDELLLRTDAPWLDAYAAQADKLIADGEALLAAKPAPTAAADPAVRPPAVCHGVNDEANRTERLKEMLTQLVIALGSRESPDEAVKSYLARVVDWENELYARRARTTVDVLDAPGTPAAAFTAAAVERYLGAKFPQWQRVQASNLRMVGGGFSKTTVMVDVEAGHTARSPNRLRGLDSF